MEKALEMLNITKRFGGLIANNDVFLQVNKGEIHALVGENGAGKTTLMNILYGLIHPDSGTIKLSENLVHIKNPQQALKLGIGMVHQHFMLSPSLTALENIVLGCTPTRYGLIDQRGARQRIEKILQQYSLNVDLSKKVYELSVGEMQRVEILKTLYRGAEILILDEPTAVLTPQETIDLFEILTSLADQGHTIIFITHKLKEVLSISNRVTVMRRGKVTGVLTTTETNEHELAYLMVGREVVLQVLKSPAKVQETVLETRNLHAKNDRGLPALRNIDLQLRNGEILGIAGVEGNGQSELVQVITGLRKTTGGMIKLRDENIEKKSPRYRRELGIAHIPEDRLRMGVEKTVSVEENLILNCYYQKPFSDWIFLNMKNIRFQSLNSIRKFNIAVASYQANVGSLSGGNMQKVVLARELANDPAVLIAAQPTRGVDVGAIEYIHQEIINLRDKGHAILLVSAELDEILSLSDRILVMYEGEFVGEFINENLSEKELGLYMAGSKRMEKTT
jgi:simple sugar transport system ATP-binding protein